MSLVFVCIILVTLFRISASAWLSDAEVSALTRNIYFIYPDFGDVGYAVGEGHAYHEHRLGSIKYVLNHATRYYRFEAIRTKERIREIGGSAREITYIAPVFLLNIEKETTERIAGRDHQIKHEVTVEYHCYHQDARQDDEALIAFYEHTQSTRSAAIYRFGECRMHIKWSKFDTETELPITEGRKPRKVIIDSERLIGLYVRVADWNKRILYLTKRATHELKNHDFWKARSYMFHENNINKFDHSFVFNPVMISVQSDVADPCNADNLAAITGPRHEGIILVDEAWVNAGYLTDECLVNIHLKNIAKQWREIWRRVKPLELSVGGRRLYEPEFENNDEPEGTPSPPTKIESSVEVMHRTRTTPRITWNECQSIDVAASRFRECTIKSVGAACLCDPPPRAGTECARHCSKKLYLMPSDHGSAYRSDDLRRFIHDKPSVKYIATELDPYRFKLDWESLYRYAGDYSRPEPDMWEACRLAIDPRNVHIKKLVLADFEPYYMCSRDEEYGFSLLRPKDNTIYPIWDDYYLELFTPIRNHVIVPTVNGIVFSDLQQSEALVLPIGRRHYDPLNPRLIDETVSWYDASERVGFREQYVRKQTVFSTYFGQGVKDLLEHPEKVKTAYKFRDRRRGRPPRPVSEWTANHKDL